MDAVTERNKQDKKVLQMAEVQKIQKSKEEGTRWENEIRRTSGEAASRNKIRRSDWKRKLFEIESKQ